jgi:DNA-binding transcriptional LysR family regulator
MWQPDPTSLRLFIAVCEEGSIARASEREGIAAAAVSKRIADMEHSLATALLSRRSRGVIPTAAGEMMLRHARHMMRAMTALQSDLSDFASGVRGVVRLVANISSIVEFVPDVIASFLQKNDKISVTLEERVSMEVVRSVAEGIADIGICRDFVAGPDVQMLPYRLDHFGVVVHRSHPLATLPTVAFEQTLEHPHIGFSSHAALNSLMRRIANDNDRQIQYRANVSTFDAACRLIQLNLGMAILPLEAISGYQLTYDLRAIPLTDVWATRRLMVCIQHVDRLSVAARRFFNHMMDPQVRVMIAPDIP